jgi:signal peptidase I
MTHTETDSAGKAGPKKKKRDRGVVREYFELIAETAVFVFFVMTFVVQAFQIPTGSMEPTLLVGDFLLVNKMIYAPVVYPFEKAILPHRDIRRQDIIVFKYPNDLSKDFVKRVIALPGETLEVRDKQVYINGRPLEEKYKVHIDSHVFSRNGMSGFSTSSEYQLENINRDNFGPLVIPPGHVFAMGDNRDNSSDSRYWGFLPLENVKGRPWLIYFSYRAEPAPALRAGLGGRLKRAFGFLSRTRWRRILKVIR